jgi:hypothetical protein
VYKNKKTVLCFFNSVVSNSYDINDNIFYINDNVFTYSIGGFREKISINNFKIEYFTEDYNNIINELKFYSPIILRWNSFGDDFELNLRKSANKIISIANLLKKFQINRCLISTGVYHHLDTLVIDLACRLCKIPRIYFYSNNISGRLIPMFQNGNITSRRPLNLKISDYDSTNDIINFQNRALKNASPLIGGQFLKTDIISFKKAVFKATYYSLRSFYLNVKNIFKNNQDDSYYFSNYPFQFFKQIINQKKALNFLNKNLYKEDLSKICKPKLLILAHYQPEATSFPEGHTLWNHIDIVYKIRSLGYNDNLFYKEHFGSIIYSTEFGPSQIGSYRDLDYYKSLLSLNCLFIQDTENKKYGGPNCELFIPITITGTVAVERSLNGLQTIVTGSPWYKGMPGVIHINDLSNLKSINSLQIEKSDEISKATFIFLKNLLSNKTLTNAFGIGTDAKIDENKLNLFLKELNMLINDNDSE